MPSVLDIVAHTPLWVWPLLLLILWQGWSGLQPHIFRPARIAILPLVGVGMALSGIAQSLQPGVALAGWAAALIAVLPLGYAVGNRRDIRTRADGRLELSGGWFALVFGVSIFAVRYALGVLFGILPALRAELLWIGLSGAVGGITTGIGLGWLANLLLRARRPATVMV